MNSVDTSRSLLALVEARDPEAWERLADLYAPLIEHWCHRLRLPEQEVADVYQEVLRAVSNNIDRFRRDRQGDTFRGWLRTITRNKVMDVFRRQRTQQRPAGGTTAMQRLAQVPEAVSAPADSDLDEDDQERQLYRQLFARALAKIRPHFHEQTWQAFWAVAIVGRPTSDVADELNMQPGTVRVAKSRVLQRLRKELGDLAE